LLPQLIVTNDSSLPRDLLLLLRWLRTVRHFWNRAPTSSKTRDFRFDVWILDVFVRFIIGTAANLSSTLGR